MVQIAGTYELVKNENFVQYLTTVLSMSEDDAKKADSLKPKVQVTVEGKKVTLNTDTGTANLSHSSTFVLNEEVEEKLPTSPVPLKTTAKLDGDTLTITSKTPDGKTGTRVYKFTDTGVVLTMGSAESGVPTATRVYKRI